MDKRSKVLRKIVRASPGYLISWKAVKFDDPLSNSPFRLAFSAPRHVHKPALRRQKHREALIRSAFPRMK